MKTYILYGFLMILFFVILPAALPGLVEIIL